MPGVSGLLFLRTRLHAVTVFSTRFFFFNDTATTEIYTLSLHDALPIYLIKDHGWHACLIEPDPRFFKKLGQRYSDNPRVTLLNEFIYKENINSLFERAGVPRDFEVLSIDVDGPDYYLWQALTDFEPKIVLVESNPSIPPGHSYVVPETDAFRLSGTAQEGASLQALYELGRRKGYHLVYIELSGANLFFVHDSCLDYFDIAGIEPAILYQPPQFGALAGGTAPNGRGYP